MKYSERINMEVDVKEQRVVKSLNDRRDYRVLKLDNGLTALLISDIRAKTKKNSSKTILDHEVDSDMDSEMDSEMDSDGSSDDGSESDGGNRNSDEDGDKRRDKEESLSCKKKSTFNREAKLTAGALCVGVGSFSDPEELPGLSHFLEHMVFMGSAKYPDENAFDAFIKKHGGSTNAFTDCERTVFKFDVRPKYFKESLDRFAQFFVSPLMKKGSIEREIKAVDSEFRMSYQDDNARKMQLFGCLTTEGHPLGKFLWGNEESLSTNPKKLGIDVNNYLELFWKKMYSSDQMTLAVISNETLDILEEWITEIFSLIPKRDSRESDIYGLNNTCSFRPDKFYKLYKVVPVKEIHQVEVTWALPPLQKYYRTKPLNYISWLLGHESRGSVLAWLKEKGWATALCAGNSGSGQEFSSIYSLFTCSVNLTVSGLEHYIEVVAVIFQYLEMLRRLGPNSRIFLEIKRIEDNHFKFKEEVDPVDYVEEIAEWMQLYPEEDYLTGGDLMWDFDEEIITYVQNSLTPEKANIMLISKTLSSECTEKERWFDTHYCDQDIDVKLKDCLRDINPELYLPEENAFIAENFDIKSSEKTHTKPKFPLMIDECGSGKVWHKQDNTFLIPKASFNFYFKSPLINHTAKNMVLAEMFISLLDFDLKDVAYAADVAGLRYRISVCETGIILNFGGFNDKLHLLFQKVIEHMMKFKVKESQFNMVKEQATRTYYNRIIKPQKLVSAVRLKILQDVKWTENDKQAVVFDITLDNLKYFSEELKSTFYVESLFQGNITSQDAIAHQKFIYRILKFKPLSKDLHPQVRVVQLPNTQSICKIEGYNTKDENTVLTNYYQIGPASGKDLVYINLLMDIMEEPCFDILRTKEQLGYSVFCGCRVTYGILGFSVTVQTQAEKYSADFVKERMDQFLDDFLRTLPDIASEVFENHVSSMIEIKKHEDLNLSEEVDRNWKEIIDETYNFERLNTEVEFLEALSKESFLEWINNIPLNSLAKKLSVQILGHKRTNSDESGGMDVNCDMSEQSWTLVPVVSSVKLCIADISIFKRNLTLFPISKIY